MAESGLEFHPTVKAYGKCPPGNGYSKLESIKEYKSKLAPPVSFKSEIQRTVDNAQEVLKSVLDAVDDLEHETVRTELQDAFTEFFGKPFDAEKWKRVHAKLKCLAPFAKDPDAVDLTIILGDDHLFEADVTILGTGAKVRCVVDTTHNEISHLNGINYVPAEATYPSVMSRKHGCTKTNLLGYRPSEDAADWEHQPVEPLKMIFICPTSLEQKATEKADAEEDGKMKPTGMDNVQGPVELNEDREIESEDGLDFLCGAPMLLIHELLHSQLMKADGGEPLDDEYYIKPDGKLTKMYEYDYCTLAAENPKNVEACEDNADSYTYFILAVYKALEREYQNYRDE